MPVRDELRLLIGDIGAAQRFDDAQLDGFLAMSMRELNVLNNSSTYSVSDLDTPSLVPDWFIILTLKRSHIQVVFTDFSNPTKFLKIQTQDVVKDPGDGASRSKKILDALIADYDKFAVNYVSLPNAGVLGLVINYSAEVGSDSLIA